MKRISGFLTILLAVLAASVLRTVPTAANSVQNGAQGGSTLILADEDPQRYAVPDTGAELFSGGVSCKLSEADAKLTHAAELATKYNRVYGVDVSRYQTDIDWEAAKAAGVDFAIIRLGYRAMASGSLVLDPYFEQNIQNAHAAGVQVGIYFFTQAITEKEAIKEGEYVVKQLAPYAHYVSYPVMIDIESAGGRLDKANLTKSKKTKICLRFCETVAAAGYTAGVYSGKNYFETKLDYKTLEESYYIWLAHYTTKTGYSGSYRMWQFSSSGKVDGITGKVDMDVAYLPKTPDSPQALSQTELTDSAVGLLWSEIPGADGYKLYEFDDDGELIETYKTTVNSMRFDGLAKGGVYRFRVRAYYKFEDGSTKYSGFSDLFRSFTTPLQVHGGTLTGSTESSATVTWTKRKVADGYHIARYDPETLTYTYLGQTTSNSFTVRGLDPEEEIHLSVRAYVLENETTKIFGLYSEPFSVQCGLKKVRNVSQDDAFATKADLSWDEDPNADGFRVFCYTFKGHLLFTKDTKTESVQLRGLTAGTVYKVKIQAFTHYNGSTVWGTKSGVKKITTAPAKIQKLRQTGRTRSSVTISWSKKKGAAAYRIYLYDKTEKEYVHIASRTGTKCRIRGLSAKTAYRIYVVPVAKQSGEKFEGARSASLRVTTSRW